jgi:adenine/guanine phosphoribosyltransferase-like PRPP-binding protein
VVLLDDVVTSGGHLEAARRYLEQKAIPVSDYAFAVARTVSEKDKAISGLIEPCPRPWDPV